MKRLPLFFAVTDVAFLLYWLITVLHLIPAQYLYNDYTNPLLVDWNWSFFPLDISISGTGFYSLYLRRTGQAWQPIALISLVLTFCSGLQAIAFWVLRHDFDPTWWLPNLYLLIYPLFFIPRLLRPATA
jgi:Family of unknown function (DUF5360)